MADGTATAGLDTSGGEPVDPATRFDFAVVGLGYVGLPLVVAASSVGMRVLGIDISTTRVESLSASRSYVDDVSDDEMAAALKAGFVASTDASLLSGTDTIAISVPTPLEGMTPDLTAVITAARTVGKHLVPGQLVIFGSTTYPGTTDEMVKPILEQESGLSADLDFDLAYSPERIDPANKEWGLRNTPKVVAGHNDEAGARAANFLGKFCGHVVTLSGMREAEMAKLIENTYRQVNIAMVNEMAIIASKLGLNLREAIRGAATKPFGFEAFYPGPGVGGHCIPIDPSYLAYRAREVGGSARLVELAQEINDSMPAFVVQRVGDVLAAQDVALAGAKVLILGVAYKEGVSDTRNTPAARIVSQLRKQAAQVSYADPLVPHFVVDGEPVPRVEDAVAATSDADIVIIHTAHRDFDLGEIERSGATIFDTRGVLSGPHTHGL